MFTKTQNSQLTNLTEVGGSKMFIKQSVQVHDNVFISWWELQNATSHYNPLIHISDIKMQYEAWFM